MDPDIEAELTARGLLPGHLGRTAAELGLVESGVEYAARFRATLLAGAIGDALGRPHERSRPSAPLENLDSLRQYRPWRGWRAGPVGTITDDTQMTMCVAASIVAEGALRPADLAARFVAWLPLGRGKGHACVEAVTNLEHGVPWHVAGVDSAGNGAAMRVAPVGLLHAVTPDQLRRDAALSAVVTHANQTAVVSAVAQAFSIAYCLHQAPGTLDPHDLLNKLSRVVGDLSELPIPERRPDRGGIYRLQDRLMDVDTLLDATASEAFHYFHNGAFVLESLPAALWCFLRYREDPERAILTAVSGGYDADTVAAMTGNLAGAYHGEAAFPQDWLDDLEFADELRTLADGLLDLSPLPRVPSAASALVVSPTSAVSGVASAVEPSRASRVVGCLLGGAIGDALGAPVEFMSLAEIRASLGPLGVTAYEPAYGRRGAITDDTQMTLFTAEGLIRADNRMADRGICNVPATVWRAYQRWLATQETGAVPWDVEFPPGPSGWLMQQPDVCHRRAPGNTCVAALRGGHSGSVDRPINDSKGCGGVMRVAPVGLVDADAFDLGCETAALTHGHPSGYLAAGTFSAVIAGILQGRRLGEAIELALAQLRTRQHHEETLEAVTHAQELAATGRPSPEAIESLGQGWVAEEALAIALYCALVAQDIRGALLLAVNHGGDSDSTGSLTGNLTGATLGVEALPADLLHALEAREVIEQVGRDLVAHFVEDSTRAAPDWHRYPAW